MSKKLSSLFISDEEKERLLKERTNEELSELIALLKTTTAAINDLEQKISGDLIKIRDAIINYGPPMYVLRAYLHEKTKISKRVIDAFLNALLQAPNAINPHQILIVYLSKKLKISLANTMDLLSAIYNLLDRLERHTEANQGVSNGTTK